MKIARLFAVLVLLGLCMVDLGAQIRALVPVVRPVFSKEGKTFYKDVAEYYRDFNPGYAEYVDGFLKDNFGSGFVVHDLSGKPVVITNVHVVDFTSQADLEFRLEDSQEPVILKDCPVLYRDDDADVAVIGIPEGNAMGITASSPCLTLAEEQVKEGQDIWAAGYPGEGKKPAWQITKGTISNQNKIVEEVALGDGIKFIQHTAAIDPGSSGGPLILGDTQDVAGMKVVGINARKGYGRDSYNLAVPVDVIKRALQSYADLSDPAKSQEQVQKKIAQFLATVNNPELQILEGRRYISDWLLARKGWTNFKEGFTKWTEKQKKELFKDQHFISPADGIRSGILLTYHYFLLRGSHDMALAKLTFMQDSGQEFYRAELMKGGRTYVVDWQLESGTYKIIGGKIPEINLWSSYEKKPSAKSVDLKDPGTAPGAAEPGHSTGAKQDVSGDASSAFKNSGFMIEGGLSAVPLWYDYGYGFAAGLGYMGSLEPWLTLGGELSLSSGSSVFVDYDQSKVLYLEGLAFARFNLAYPEQIFLKNGILPYLSLGASAGMSYVAGNDDTGKAEELGFAWALRPGAGIQFLFQGGTWGFELSPRFSWYDSAYPRLNGIDVKTAFTL